MEPDLRRRRLLLALCAFPPAAVAASRVLADTGDAQRARGTVRIGVSGPFSGDSQAIGISMREGVRIAAARINAAGGVLGRPLELVERDDQASNERGAQIAQELIEREQVVAVVGIVNTGVALASQRHYQAARIPVITAVATGSMITRQFQPPDFPHNYVFRAAASDRLQARAMVDEAAGREGLTRLAIFHDGTNYGVLGSADLEAELRIRTLRALLVERLAPAEAAVSQQLRRARAAGAEAILAYGAGAELALLANAAAHLRWPVPIIGSWTLASAPFIRAAGRNADGVRMPQTFVTNAGSQAAREFVLAWRTHTRSEIIPVPPAAAQGYDSTLILAAAIDQAGSLDGKRIREALENLQTPVQGIIMTYDRPYSRDRHETLTESAQLHIGEIRDGRIVQAHATGEARTTAVRP